ncbi:MAG: hypothetical protein J6S82_03630 [Bacteroidales bacterium]|nr:hypothetical protein [Bacteroidales bacterium]
MLQQVCEYIHNYFIQARHPGRYDIADGMISLPLLDGQRFLITGSVLNDGVYTYHDTGITNDDDTEAAGLHDETFAGTICALAVPPAVIALSGEIKAWVDENGAALNSPYSSENVLGVYSYTKATGGSGAGGSVTWGDVFGGQLNRWRKVSF